MAIELMQRVHYVQDDYEGKQAGDHLVALVQAVYADDVVDLVLPPGQGTVSGCSRDEIDKLPGTYHVPEPEPEPKPELESEPEIELEQQ